MDIQLESKQMEGKAPNEQSKRAIAHCLNTIVENPEVYYHLGFGTQTFSLLTEAAATLFEKPVEEVRRNFMTIAQRYQERARK